MRAALLGFAHAWIWTIVIEGAVLWPGLDARHSRGTRLLAAVWLSSCTLPWVHFVFPRLQLVGWTTLEWVTAAEVFAVVVECLLFAALVGGAKKRGATTRDYVAIVLANIASFTAGELMRAF